MAQHLASRRQWGDFFRRGNILDSAHSFSVLASQRSVCDKTVDMAYSTTSRQADAEPDARHDHVPFTRRQNVVGLPPCLKVRTIPACFSELSV